MPQIVFDLVQAKFVPLEEAQPDSDGNLHYFFLQEEPENGEPPIEGSFLYLYQGLWNSTVAVADDSFWKDIITGENLSASEHCELLCEQYMVMYGWDEDQYCNCLRWFCDFCWGSLCEGGC